MAISKKYGLNPFLAKIGLNLISVYDTQTEAPHTSLNPGTFPDYFCAIITMDGNGQIVYKNNLVKKVEQGDLYFFCYDDVQELACNEGKWHYHTYWFQILGVSLPTDCIKISLDDEEDFIKTQISLLQEGTSFSIKYANSLMLTRIIKFIKNFAEKNDSKKYPETLNKALSFINNNLGYPFKLKDLAKELNYCERQLCNIFTQHLGTSPKQYIISERIKRACTFLSTTYTSIELIADSLGFYSTSHFITTFKNAMGVSPTQYRKQGAIKRD